MIKGEFNIRDRLISLIECKDWKSLKNEIEKLDAVEVVELFEKLDEKE